MFCNKAHGEPNSIKLMLYMKESENKHIGYMGYKCKHGGRCWYLIPDDGICGRTERIKNQGRKVTR